MNKTGPNFLKSNRNIDLDESLESEMLGEMNQSFINEQNSRRQGSGFMPSISSAGGINSTRMDP